VKLLRCFPRRCFSLLLSDKQVSNIIARKMDTIGNLYLDYISTFLLKEIYLSADILKNDTSIFFPVKKLNVTNADTNNITIIFPFPSGGVWKSVIILSGQIGPKGQREISLRAVPSQKGCSKRTYII
jgi:hypothetical protein